MPLLLLPIVAFACSSQSSKGTKASPDAGTESEAACEPRPHHDAGTGTGGGSSDGGLIVGGGEVDADLNSGVGMPAGRMLCSHPESGVGFDCESFGMACCDKKDVCYDPATEASFCDLPYCP